MFLNIGRKLVPATFIMVNGSRGTASFEEFVFYGPIRSLVFFCVLFMFAASYLLVTINRMAVIIMGRYLSKKTFLFYYVDK